MSLITTYGELKTAIAGKINRSDLTSHLPGFVQRAEEEFRRELRQVDNLYRYEDFPFTDEYTAIPNDWQEGLAFEVYVNGYRRSIPITSSALINRVGTEPGEPLAIMVLNDQLRMIPPPSGTMTGDLLYWRGITTITSGDSAFNWLLTKHSAVYLYRALMEAAIHMKNNADVERYAGAYQGAMASVTKSGRKRRQSAGMYVRLG